MVAPILRTARTLLREWRTADLAPFAALNADPTVMQHFPSLLTRQASDGLVARFVGQFAALGFGPWALELPGVAPFAGFVGLVRQEFPAHFTPAVEIGWRLARPFWGQGYATEAGREVLRFADEVLALPALVSMTVPGNVRSIAVMERLGFRRDPADDFDHPKLPEGHALRRHVLYRRSSGR